MEAGAAWDDDFQITGIPAVTAKEVLRVAEPMSDVPATALFTEVPGSRKFSEVA